MQKFFHHYAPYLSLLLFLISVLIAGKVFASDGSLPAEENPTGLQTINPSPLITDNPQQGSEQTVQKHIYSQPMPPRVPSQQQEPLISFSPSITPHISEGMLPERPLMQLNASKSGETREMFHPQAFTQVHLQGSKLQACQSLASSVTTRSNHLVDLVTQQVKTFNGIALGIEQYYLKNVVPTGAILTNYDSLVADITTKQNVITTPLMAAENDITNFSCTGNNPAAQLTQFRTDMQAVLTALQAYRTSIKNLIIALSTLPSVAPSVTPGVTP